MRMRSTYRELVGKFFTFHTHYFVLLEFGFCLGTSSVDQEVPHLLETVLKETGHSETVSVGTAVPGTDSQNYLMLSGIVADSIPIFNHCSEAEEYPAVGYR